MREITYLEAVREAMTQEMERDESVFMIGEDIGQYGGAFGASFGMLEQFGPERILDTPITELGLTGAATGAALVGMRPIAEIMFMDFTTLASEQLVNQAAKLRFMFGGKATVPMVLRTAAGSGATRSTSRTAACATTTTCTVSSARRSSATAKCRPGTWSCRSTSTRREVPTRRQGCGCW